MAKLFKKSKPSVPKGGKMPLKLIEKQRIGAARGKINKSTPEKLRTSGVELEHSHDIHLRTTSCCRHTS